MNMRVRNVHNRHSVFVKNLQKLNLTFPHVFVSMRVFGLKSVNANKKSIFLTKNMEISFKNYYTRSITKFLRGDLI